MKYLTFLFFLFLTFFTNGQVTNQVQKNKLGNLSIIDLGYEFKLSFSEKEDFGSFKTYSKIKIFFHDHVVYRDSTTEFEISDKYPAIRKIRDKFEILLFVNDRPSIEKLEMLIIAKGKVLKKELLPNFAMSPRDIDNDGVLELVGIMSYYEMYENSMPYDPILAYEYTNKGIKIDTIETKKINTRVYGKFYGFAYNAKYTFKGNDRFEKELRKYK